MLRYNVGIGAGSSVREVIRVAEEATGRPIKVEEDARRPGDPPMLVAGSGKIRAELGWEPKYTHVRDVIETAWNWHQSHPNGYPAG